MIELQIKESAENYLECILMLKRKNGSVRSVDVAHSMEFTKASVSVAMKHLREDEFIVVEKDGEILLTEKGMAVAERVYERHNLIAKFLIAIGVSEETAFLDSCKIEHDLSSESFEKLKAYFLNNLAD